MNSTMAKASAAASVFLIAAASVTLWVTSHPSAGQTTVKAEFEDAFPILAGMNVRVSGAVAGSVRGVDLTDDGTVDVTLSLNEGTPPPRADASAAIRQQDVTGDSYVSVSLGSAPDELGSKTIPTSRTLVAPRFDDLLNSFEEPERVALQTILVEAGKTLEQNGDDLNAAALKLRPAFEATDQLLGEIGSQNRALRSLVANSEKVTGQAADRSRDLGRLVDSLSGTLQATADHAPALDRALAVLPQTTGKLHGTLTSLRRTAVAAKPVAHALEDGAPRLVRTLELAPPFLGDARRSLERLSPTLDLLTDGYRLMRPTVAAAPDRVLTAPFELTGSVDDLLRILLGNEDVLKTLFGADAYGKPPGNADDIGLGAVAVETGAQAGWGDADPNRNLLRNVIIPSCEAFGLPIAPGCLSDALAGMSQGAKRKPKREGRPSKPTAPAPLPPHDAAGAPPQVGSQPQKPPKPQKPQAPLPLLPLPGGTPGGGGNGNILDSTTALLDFLLGGGR